MTVIANPRRVRLRSLVTRLLRRTRDVAWEPTKLPRGVTREMVEERLGDMLTAKEQAEPWLKIIDDTRIWLEDIPSDVYGPYGLRRYRPRRILDQKAARNLIERLGEVVPWTHSKAPIKVERA